jgi:hypothetical protein
MRLVLLMLLPVGLCIRCQAPTSVLRPSDDFAILLLGRYNNADDLGRVSKSRGEA